MPKSNYKLPVTDVLPNIGPSHMLIVPSELEAVSQFEAFAAASSGDAASSIELDQFLLRTICNPSLRLSSRTIDAIASKHSGHRDAIDTCLALNEIIGAPTAVIDSRRTERLAEGDEIGARMPDGRPRYRVSRFLARGRSGSVYEAVDQLLSARSKPSCVALKVFPGVERNGVHALIDEARKARRISHPNVARVFDAGHDRDHAYCVSEFVAGESLVDRDCSAMGWREVARLVAEIADGAAAIHAAGIVHSDIKPSNVVLREDRAPVIVDFGSASEPRDTSRGVGAFTLAFSAPEQIVGGSRDAIPASDVYAIGSVAVWMLLGRPVAGRTIEDVVTSHMKGCDGQAGRIERLLQSRGVPSDLCAVLSRATARQPRFRHENARSLAEDVRTVLARKPIEWTAPGPVKRARLHVRRRPIASLLALVACVGGAVGVVQSHKANYLSREVVEQRTIAAVERANAEAEKAWKIEAGTRLQELLRGFSLAQARGLHEEVLLSLWLLEWTHTDGVLSDPEALDQIWNSRIEVLRDVQQRYPGTMLARLVDPSLALWLIAAGQFSEALAISERAIEQTEAIAGPDDPWLSRLVTLRDIAAMNSSATDSATRDSLVSSLRSRASAGELNSLPRQVRARVMRLVDYHAPN